MTIEATLSGRLKAELQHRDERRHEALARLHEVFADELGLLPEEPPIELGELPAEQLAQLTVDVLWPPGPEERRERALAHIDAVSAVRVSH